MGYRQRHPPFFPYPQSPVLPFAPPTCRACLTPLPAGTWEGAHRAFADTFLGLRIIATVTPNLFFSQDAGGGDTITDSTSGASTLAVEYTFKKGRFYLSSCADGFTGRDFKDDGQGKILSSSIRTHTDASGGVNTTELNYVTGASIVNFDWCAYERQPCLRFFARMDHFSDVNDFAYPSLFLYTAPQDGTTAKTFYNLPDQQPDRSDDHHTAGYVEVPETDAGTLFGAKLKVSGWTSNYSLFYPDTTGGGTFSASLSVEEIT